MSKFVVIDLVINDHCEIEATTLEEAAQSFANGQNGEAVPITEEPDERSAGAIPGARRFVFQPDKGDPTMFLIFQR